MIKQVNYLLFLVTTACLSLNGQTHNTLGIASDTIYFHLTSHNNIAVNSVINEKDTIPLMFHTDIGSVSLTPELSHILNNASERQASDAQSWRSKEEVEYIENNKLKIENFQWDSLTIWLDLLSGPETGGKFGPNLFVDKLIEIDFDNDWILLHHKDNKQLDLSSFKSLPLLVNQYNSLYIKGTLTLNDQSFDHEFLIHSGYGGTIILDDAFCTKNEKLRKTEIIKEDELKDSFGNIIKTKKALSDYFSIGDIHFEKMPYSFFDSPLEIQKTSVMGGEMLKRFNLIIDIENKQLHFKPNKYTFTKFKSS